MRITGARRIRALVAVGAFAAAAVFSTATGATAATGTTFDLNGTFIEAQNQSYTGVMTDSNDFLTFTSSHFGGSLTGLVENPNTISLVGAFTQPSMGRLLSPNVIQWDTGAVWEKVWTGALQFPVDGVWTAGGPGHAVISNRGGFITVDMSAYGRPTATGWAEDARTLKIRFPDDATFTATLDAPGHISWSNNTAWTLIPQVTVPNIVGMTRIGATSALSAVGLLLGNETDVPNPYCQPAGTVAGQAPQAGSIVLRGSSIAFQAWAKAKNCF